MQFEKRLTNKTLLGPKTEPRNWVFAGMLVTEMVAYVYRLVFLRVGFFPFPVFSAHFFLFSFVLYVPWQWNKFFIQIATKNKVLYDCNLSENVCEMKMKWAVKKHLTKNVWLTYTQWQNEKNAIKNIIYTVTCEKKNT